MDIVWMIVFVLLIYFSTVISISAIRTIMDRRNGRGIVKEAFKETCWDLFLELLNPFNWF